MTWEPRLYEKFKRERAQPFEDLLQLLKVRSGQQVVDLGCGTGELSRKLQDFLPESQVLGIDHSAEMLEGAQARCRKGLRFELGNLEALSGYWDLIFSNAALHWVPDHHHLITALLAHLKPGGQLAVQVPSNHDHLSQVLIRELAGEEPFRTALQGWVRHSPVLSLREYAELLYEQGIREMTVLEKIYPHELKDADAMADWVSGSTLVPYFEKLSEGLREQLMTEYRARLRRAFPGSPVFFGFRRILLAASLGAQR